MICGKETHTSCKILTLSSFRQDRTTTRGRGVLEHGADSGMQTSTLGAPDIDEVYTPASVEFLPCANGSEYSVSRVDIMESKAGCIFLGQGETDGAVQKIRWTPFAVRIPGRPCLGDSNRFQIGKMFSC